jgi:3-hydroxyisobutyrate dehydrogenase-like beta-hydroxyacid dehydrogenase
MSNIAFLGLGQMGAPMATRLLDAGHDLAVWNRTPDRAKPLVERGARRALSPLEAAAGVEFAITGAAMKLVVNSTLGAAIVALDEALMLGQSLGLERVVLDVLEGSPIGPTVCAKRSNVKSGRYPPSFKLNLADKDLRLATEAGDRLAWT